MSTTGLEGPAPGAPDPAVAGGRTQDGRTGALPAGWRDALRGLATPWSLAALGLLLAAATLVRAWDLDQADQRAGEILTEFRATAPLGDALASTAEPRNQGPLYFLMLRALPNDSIVDMRVPSVVLGVLTVVLLVVVVTAAFSDRVLGLWSGALLAVSPLHALLSRLARPYGLLTLLAVAVTGAFLALLAGARSRGWWIGFTVLSALAYLTHFTALALGVSQAVALLVARRRDGPLWRRWALAQIVAIAPLVAWMSYATDQQGDPSEGSIPGPTLKTPARAVANLLTGAGIEGAWWMIPGTTVAVVALIAGGVWAWRRRDDGAGRTLLVTVVVTLVPTFVAVLTITSKYSDRYLVVAVPALLVLVAAGALRTPRIPPAVGVAALCLVTATGAVVSVRMAVDEREPAEDWSGAAAIVAAQAGPGDLVVFPRESAEEAFTAALPAGAAPQWTDLDLDVTPDTTAAEAGAGRVFVVYRNPIEDFHTGAYKGFDPYEPGLSNMSDWLVARRARVVEDTPLEGIRLIELDPEERPAG